MAPPHHRIECCDTGGKTKPDAGMQDRTVWVRPFSAEVTLYTWRRPNSVITLPGLCTTVTPVSLELNTCSQLV